MSNDKLRDAIETALIKLKENNKSGAYIVLKKALEPEQEFYPGQHVFTCEGEQGIYLHKKGVFHLVYFPGDNKNHFIYPGDINPDPDWSPPGFAKKPNKIDVLRLADNYVDKCIQDDNLYGCIAKHMTEFALSFWPESERE